MPSSINHHVPMVLHRELDLFYGTPIVCGCSKTLSHYINGQLSKVDGLIPPTTVNDIIGDIQKIHRNTSICSIFLNLEAKPIMVGPKLTNPSHFVESKSSSEPK